MAQPRRNNGADTAARRSTVPAVPATNAVQPAAADALQHSAAPPAEAPEDGELALQPIHNDAPAAAAPRNRPRRMPEAVSGGRPLDIGDTSRLLVYAGIAAVVVVLAGFYMLLGSGHAPVRKATAEIGVARNDLEKKASALPTLQKETKDPPTTNASTSVALPAAPLPHASATRATSAPVAPAAQASNLNPTNKQCYFAYVKFMNWAYSSALKEKCSSLLERFGNEVPQAGVSDPEVLELCSQAREMFQLNGENTLSDYGIVMRPAGVGRQVSIEHTVLGRKLREININLRVLNRKLEARYGKPEIVTPPALAEADEQKPPPKAEDNGVSFAPGGKPFETTKKTEDAKKGEAADEPPAKSKITKLPFEPKTPRPPKASAGGGEVDDE